MTEVSVKYNVHYHFNVWDEKYILFFFYFYINTLVQQIHLKLIKSDSNDIYNVTNIFIFKINAVFRTFLQRSYISTKILISINSVCNIVTLIIINVLVTSAYYNDFWRIMWHWRQITWINYIFNHIKNFSKTTPNIWTVLSTLSEQTELVSSTAKMAVSTPSTLKIVIMNKVNAPKGSENATWIGFLQFSFA